ncbi:unknown protein [Seminavis robusta]|uniref:Uncharacterized protein n=1 Tax=Seminavis robusta TaxID=568900 RepID=A0A9N8F455_9STRA|nr:unknown protein [Seminavis robusta]|eukprot:Sro2807_g337540.1 n/a (77) ;mRNA; f:2945-3175
MDARCVQCAYIQPPPIWGEDELPAYYKLNGGLYCPDCFHSEKAKAVAEEHTLAKEEAKKRWLTAWLGSKDVPIAID